MQPHAYEPQGHIVIHTQWTQTSVDKHEPLTPAKSIWRVAESAL